MITGKITVFDPLTGLVSQDYLRTRLGELYRAADVAGYRVSERHALVVVRLDLELAAEKLVAQGLLIGHAFGNQHAPADIDGAEIRIPLITSEATARATVDRLLLERVSVAVADVALGRFEPLSTGHAHHHG